MAAEIVPLVTSMLTQMLDKAGQAASTPVIGIHHEHTSTSRKSHEVSKTEYDFSLRAWEIVLGLGIFSVWEFSQSVAGLFKGVDPLWFISPVDAFITQTIEADLSNGTKAKPTPQNMSLMQYLEAKIILSMEHADMNIEDIIASLFPNGLPFNLGNQNTSTSSQSQPQSNLLSTFIQGLSGAVSSGVVSGVIKTETGLGQGSGSGIPTTQGIAKVIENSSATAKKDVENVVNTIEKNPVVETISKDVSGAVKTAENSSATAKKKIGGIVSWIRSKL